MSGSHDRVPDWFERSGGLQGRPEQGLRFACTSCGNCCSGGPGYVRFTPDEARAMAGVMGVSEHQFLERYTHDTPIGRSLNERDGERGYDCVFLDRDRVPGKALCAVYEARPLQCRTWPFWPENMRSRESWERAGKSCPGMNTGPLHAPQRIRLSIERMLEWDR